jgi:integrase
VSKPPSYFIEEVPCSSFHLLISYLLIVYVKRKFSIKRDYPYFERLENRGLEFHEERFSDMKLISNCADHLKPIVTLAVHTGMRRGEIMGLEWDRVDVERGIITFLDTKRTTKERIYP